MPFFSGIGNEYDICMRGFLEESALSTLKVENAEGRNFREFANFRESLNPWKCIFLSSCENILFGSLCKILTKKVENRPENAQKWIYLFIYLTAKVYTPEFFTAKVDTRKSLWSHKASLVCPLGLLSAGAFVRRAFYPLGLLPVGACTRGTFFGGAFVRGAFVRGAFVRAQWYLPHWYICCHHNCNGFVFKRLQNLYEFEREFGT